MSTPRKPDSEAIKQHISDLKQQSWLGEARAWWPNFLFRFDHIEAAAKILNNGKVLSRNAAVAAGVMALDCASPEVIANTAPRWKKCVRLYFRPRTPMQYDSEGFRPPNQYVLGSHCPVPVVMLFNASDILTHADAEFSDGNLAASASTGNSAAFLRVIPFEKVYHDSWLAEERKRSIIFHRHAEVIVPNEMDLSPLRFVCCRTQAEYETLLHLLEPEAREKWAEKIGLGTKLNLHYRYWTFVEQVELSSKRIRFQFNPSSRTPGPFRVRVEIREDATGNKYSWESKSYLANSILELNLQPVRHPESYTVRLELDGQLAYSNHYEEYNVPF